MSSRRGRPARGPAARRWLAIPAFAACAFVAACGWDPSRPFDRESPLVRGAVADLDAGDAGSAAQRLQEYLSTGACKDGSIGTPEILKRRADGTFDLGLSLFRIGERYGRPFGEEEVDAGIDEATRARRHAYTECARSVLEAIAEDPTVARDLRTRALYLEGNLAFLDGAYERAVRAYDEALTLEPGEADSGDPTGRDAAHNRAIALRRIDDRKDAGNDASDNRDGGGRDGSRDGGQNDRGDAGRDGSSGGRDAAGDRGDAGADVSSPQPQPDAASPEPDAGPQAPPPSSDEDERMLDQLENAPTLQQEQAKRFAGRRARGMVDK